MTKKRTDTSTKIINASANAIYEAFIDPNSLAQWLPPKGMSAKINQFEGRTGGRYQITLTYDNKADQSSAKSADGDVTKGKFLELTPGKRVSQTIDFVSDDPAFSGTMTMTYDFVTVDQGTRVTITAENVPEGISPKDHQDGMNSTLDNLNDFMGKK